VPRIAASKFVYQQYITRGLNILYAIIAKCYRCFLDVCLQNMSIWTDNSNGFCAQCINNGKGLREALQNDILFSILYNNSRKGIKKSKVPVS